MTGSDSSCLSLSGCGWIRLVRISETSAPVSLQLPPGRKSDPLLWLCESEREFLSWKQFEIKSAIFI